MVTAILTKWNRTRACGPDAHFRHRPGSGIRRTDRCYSINVNEVAGGQHPVKRLVTGRLLDLVDQRSVSDASALGKASVAYRLIAYPARCASCDVDTRWRHPRANRVSDSAEHVRLNRVQVPEQEYLRVEPVARRGCYALGNQVTRAVVGEKVDPLAGQLVTLRSGQGIDYVSGAPYELAIGQRVDARPVHRREARGYCYRRVVDIFLPDKCVVATLSPGDNRRQAYRVVGDERRVPVMSSMSCLRFAPEAA